MRNLRFALGTAFAVVVFGGYSCPQSLNARSLHTFVSSMFPQESSGQEESTGTDTEPARAFRASARVLFDHEKFDDLDRIAAKVRSGKERFRGGAWKLFVFYDTIEGPGSLTSTDEVWDAHIERLRRWIAAKPDSITPRVALAKSYLKFAWKARGNGYGDTVTKPEWEVFKQRVQQARDTLEQAESLPQKDPQWFRDMQTVALAQGWDQKQEDDLLQQASSYEPGYFYFYNAHADYLLPKWYGKRGDAEAFAQATADRIGGPEGDFIYLRIAYDANCCKSKQQMPGLSWGRVKQGFAAQEQLYGVTNRQLNAMAFMAVRQGDRNFAQEIFSRIGDNWDEAVWHSKQKFNESKTSLSLERAVEAKQ
jgi:hypothetical protein